MQARAGRVWSTADVPAGEAASYWREAVCEAFVQVHVQPGLDAGFTGSMSYKQIGKVGLSTVSSRAQRVHRGRGLIAKADERHLLANIQLAGTGLVSQDERSAVLTPGSLTLVDSAEPYAMEFTGEFTQLVLRIPWSLLAPGIGRAATGIALPASGPAGIVTDFLRGVDRMDVEPAGELMPHALGLIETAMRWAGGSARTESEGIAFTRERIQRFVRAHHADSRLDVGMVAAGCRISRRTLFRALAEDEKLTALIRRSRVEAAIRLLRTRPNLPVPALARECGFGGVAQLHRAFKSVTGTTPAGFRAGAVGTDRH